MNDLRQIITATDCTEGSVAAVDRGFQLAAVSGAAYTLAHALGLDELVLLQGLLGDRLPEVTLSLTREATRMLEALVADPAHHHGTTASIAVDTGSASRFVHALAQSRHADLLLLGGTSSDPLHRAIMGSTASRLQRTSPCPVLNVKRPVTGPYRRALVAVDFSPNCDALIAAARRVAPDASLVLLHAFAVPFEGKLHVAGVQEETVHAFRAQERERVARQLRELAAQHHITLAEGTTVVAHGDPATQILEHEVAQGCDLIVVGRHDPSVAERLLLGSVTKKVLAGSRGDVLVVLQEPRDTSTFA
jgi:nucleotide-binding universal stress UspA family protein